MQGTKKNIIFMGTPAFGAPALELLIQEHNVVAVFTSPPKPCGRRLQIQKTPIHQVAEKNNIQVYSPKTLRNEEVLRLINSIDADIIVVCAYGFIIPPKILEAKKYGCVNLHPSKLPRFRGASPLQHTIIEGDNTSAICIIKMDAGIDTGPILAQHDFVLPKRPALSWLHDYTAHNGADILSKAISSIEYITPVLQSTEGATYANKLSKEDSYINWKMSAEKIDSKIRGYVSWPGSITKSNLGDIKIIEARSISLNHNNNPAAILDHNDLIIACGEHAIQIDILQLPGKKTMDTRNFLNGHKLEWLA